MSLKIDRVQLEIVIQQDTARQKMIQLEEKMRDTRKELRKLKEGTAEYTAKAADLKALQKEYDGLFEKIGIGALSLKELGNRQKELNAIIRQLPGDSMEYKQYNKQLQEVNSRIKELKGNANEAQFSVGKLADGFNKYAAMGASIIASLTGVSLAIKKCVADYAQISEVMANVRKYTGMTSNEVKDLNEDLKKMDTRTSREQLNNLASDAGKLGVSGKKNILDFVDAANIINVSLGEDLGKDAVANIGKLAQMFGDDKTMGLRGAMLATGSAINAVAQNSSAAEPYLVDFMSRVSGTGKQAGISQAQIIGYASVLDQNMQQVEMSATAVQNLIMKVYQQPAKFAAMAGKSVKEFSDLIKNDANEAILTLIESLSKKGGLQQLAPIFKDMGLDGVRASGVLSTLASNVDAIRKQQELATASYKEGTSVLSEYNIQNNTVQGKLDKAKKGFQEISYELGEKLEPYIGSLIISTGSLIRVFSKIITFMITHSNTLIALTTAVVAYTIATQGAVVMNKLQVLWTDKIVVALKSMYSTMMANPYLAAAAAIGILFGIMKDYNHELTEAEIKQKQLNDIRDEANKNIAVENKELEQLLSIAKDETLSKGEREAAIKRLNEISPEYFGNLTLEKIGTIDADKAVKDYTESIYALAEAEAIRAKLKEVTENKISVMGDMNSNKGLWDNLLGGNFNEIWQGSKAGLANMVNQASTLLKGTTDNWADQTIDQWANRYVNKLKGLAKEETDLTKMLKDNITKSLSRKGDDTSGSGGNGGTGGTGDKDKDKKPWNARLQEEENYYNDELLLLRKKSDERGQTEAEYQMDILQKEAVFQLKKLAIIKEYQGKTTNKKNLAELGKLESETSSALYNSLKNSEENRLTLLKEYRDKRLDKIKRGEEEINLQLSKEYEAGSLSEKDYKNRVTAIEVASATERLAILQDYQSDVNDLEFKNGEKKALVVKEAGSEVINAEKEISNKRAEIANKSAELIDKYGELYKKQNDNASMGETLNALDIFYQSQLDFALKNGIDTTNLTKIYEEAKKDITEEYAKERADVVKKYSLETAEENRDIRLKALEEEHARGLLREEEYERAKSEIANNYLKDKIQANKGYYDIWMQFLSDMGSAVQGFQDAEVSSTEYTYDKKIKAARKAGKDTTKLEEEKEEAVAAVKKKYAEMQFAINVMQTISSTALSAMLAYASLAWIPGVGPVLGAAAAAAAIAAGAAQIAVAKQQRDQAKGLKEGGYSGDYIEGYTKSGNPDETAGAIPVHKNEFVANHNAVANPHVKQFLDVFDVAQKNGSIRMLNTTQILEQVRTKTGKYSGGYVMDDSSSGSGSSTGGSSAATISLPQVINLIRESNRLLGIISVKDLKVNAKDVRDEIKRIEKLEQNVSR